MLAQLEQAQLDLISAQDSLDATRLYAPISGMVMSINANVGDTLGTSVIMTIATPDDLVARVYMDETDLDNATVGNKTLLTFDAFPDIVVAGEIIMVEQALQTVDGTPVVVSWATFENEANLSILSGMTVDVEIIGGEALGALLVPIQALREIAPGSYAVFIVDADGSLKLTPVTVGLRDFANAEILTGVEAGDIVSTGVVETK
jgi:RND family efflux transporter MFP subunit